jgi:hypothetical protein
LHRAKATDPRPSSRSGSKEWHLLASSESKTEEYLPSFDADVILRPKKHLQLQLSTRLYSTYLYQHGGLDHHHHTDYANTQTSGPRRGATRARFRQLAHTHLERSGWRPAAPLPAPWRPGSSSSTSSCTSSWPSSPAGPSTTASTRATTRVSFIAAN